MKAYVCIGGPLDGKHASSDDFVQERIQYDYKNVIFPLSQEDKTKLPFTRHPSGCFAMYQRDYLPFNGGNRNGITSMVWIHRSLLHKPVPANRPLRKAPVNAGK